MKEERTFDTSKYRFGDKTNNAVNARKSPYKMS
jgi:hypothetical protein